MKYCNSMTISELEKTLENLSFLDAQRLFIISILRDFCYDEDKEIDAEYDYELKDNRTWEELTEQEKLTLVSMVEEVYYDTDSFTLGKIADCVMEHKVGIIEDILGTNEIIDFLIYGQ